MHFTERLKNVQQSNCDDDLRTINLTELSLNTNIIYRGVSSTAEILVSKAGFV